jgi:CDP-diglyceride synthetase
MFLIKKSLNILIRCSKLTKIHSPAKTVSGFYIVVWISIIVTIFASCSKDDTPEPVRAKRTVIVYMAADNDMSGDAFNDIEEMKEGFSETGANLAVFIDPAGDSPYLLEIAENAETKIMTYTELMEAK